MPHFLYMLAETFSVEIDLVVFIFSSISQMLYGRLSWAL